MQRMGQVDAQEVIDALVSDWALECAGHRGDTCESCRAYESAICTVAFTATKARGLTVEQVKEHMGQHARLTSTMCAGDRVVLVRWEDSQPDQVAVAWEHRPSAILPRMVVHVDAGSCEHFVSRFDLALV
jgi:hypothetical protein